RFRHWCRASAGGRVPRSRTPQVHNLAHDLCDRPVLRGGGTKVKRLRKTLRIMPLPHSQKEVTRTRLKDVLPWPHRLRIPYLDAFAGLECSNTFRDEPVGCPVATADDIAGPGVCEAALRLRRN